MRNIHPDTFSFLKELAENNHRDWFNQNKPRYLEIKDALLSFSEELIVRIKEFDPHIPPSLSAKQTIFRIYRDTRFSKDKTPYKKYISIAIEEPGYYLHLEPNNCFVGGGYWSPEPQQLASIRQEIDYNGDRLRKTLDQKSFKTAFGKLDESNILKNPPKGYDKENPHVDLLKLKSFVVSRPFQEQETQKSTFSDWVIDNFKLISPLTLFLRESSSSL